MKIQFRFQVRSVVFALNPSHALLRTLDIKRFVCSHHNDKTFCGPAKTLVGGFGDHGQRGLGG